MERSYNKIKVQCRIMKGVNKLTVWTWNAIGKRKGAWNLDPKSPETEKAFIINHIIPDLLPKREDGYNYSNSDPITGQAAWYDLKVDIYKCKDNEIDYKVIAVPHWAPKSRYPRLNSIEPEHLKIFKQFFRIYKIDRASTVKVGEWKNGKKATTVVLNAHNRWQERQKNGNV